MQMLQQIKTRIAEINKQKEELVSQLRKDFAPSLAPLFKKSNGKITSLGWVQYTPYFNDGDECEFSVNTDLDYGIRVNGEYLDNSEFFQNSTYGLSKYLKKDVSYEDCILRYPEDVLSTETMEKELELYEILMEFQDILESIDDEFLKDLFGDHVEVTIFADGSVTTEEYDHD